MDNKEIFKHFDSGYKEGYFRAAQEVASVVLRLIDNHPSWMLESERGQAKTSIKLATKQLLSMRGIIPYSSDVITGKAKEVPVDFDMKV